MKCIFSISDYLFSFLNLIMPLYKQFMNMLVLFIIALTAAYLISLVTQRVWWPNEPTYNWSWDIIGNTSGAVVETPDFTGDINTGAVVEVPNDPRLYLEYIIEYWTGGEDYIAFSPTNQPDMSSQAWGENTTKMHKYIHENRIVFNLPDTKKQWYILFITTRKLKWISNLFLWVDGKTIWWLDKNDSITKDTNEYLYPLNNIAILWNGGRSMPQDLSKWPLSLNAVVGESNNKVEKIIIFFK